MVEAIETSSEIDGVQRVVDDYLPLTGCEEIIALLGQVRQDPTRYYVPVYIRLHRGIRGMVDPPPTRGPVAAKDAELVNMFARSYRQEPTPEVVDRILHILNG